jgi:hypothetical protein
MVDPCRGRGPEGGLIDPLKCLLHACKLIPKFCFSDVFWGLNNGTAKFQKNVIHAVFDGLGIISRIVLSYELHDIIFQPLPAERLKVNAAEPCVCCFINGWTSVPSRFARYSNSRTCIRGRSNEFGMSYEWTVWSCTWGYNLRLSIGSIYQVFRTVPCYNIEMK